MVSTHLLFSPARKTGISADSDEKLYWQAILPQSDTTAGEPLQNKLWQEEIQDNLASKYLYTTLWPLIECIGLLRESAAEKVLQSQRSGVPATDPIHHSSLLRYSKYPPSVMGKQGSQLIAEHKSGG